MTRKEKINQLNDIFAEINEDDNAVCYLTSEDNELIESAIEALSQESCYNPDEWCRTCSEYNQEKHCCPRYNKVIRNAVEEMKETNIRTAEWVLLDECSNSGYYCSECHKKLVKEGWSGTVKKIKYCPNCGCRMVEPQESEETDASSD
jgi:hypothetical protein